MHIQSLKDQRGITNFVAAVLLALLGLLPACGGSSGSHEDIQEDGSESSEGSDTPTEEGDGGGPDSDSQSEGGSPDGETDDIEADADAGEGGGTDTLVLRYHRPRGDYAGWSAEVTGDVAGGPTFQPASTDDFGLRFEIPLGDAAASVRWRFVNGDIGEPNAPADLALAGAPQGLWVFSAEGLEGASAQPPFTTAPPVIPGPNQVAIHYLRTDGDYVGWGLHLWEDVANETSWSAPLMPTTVDPRVGASFLADLAPGAARVGVIAHKGDTKDPGPDMFIELEETGNMVFLLTGSTQVFSAPVVVPEFSIAGARAHWLLPDTIAWSAVGDVASYELVWDLDGKVTVEDGEIAGGQSISLSPGGDLSPALQLKWPHLKSRAALKVGESDLNSVRTILQGEIAVVARDAGGRAVDATRVQIPGLLDALYAESAAQSPLGQWSHEGKPRFALWAPTAQDVKLEFYHAPGELAEVVQPEFDVASGIWWFHSSTTEWMGKYYRYVVTVYHPASDKVEVLPVTDPYAFSLSADSEYAHIVDFADFSLKPPGWDAIDKPPLQAAEDIVIYEAHVRDFSAHDPSVPESERGTFRAFRHTGQGGTSLSGGLKHLGELADAGLTHLHLLPFFDVATIAERRSGRVEISDPFSRLCSLNSAVPAATCAQYAGQTIAEVFAAMDPAGSEVQKVMGWMRHLDGFNWGYDPFHFNAVEGSYATNPDGATRIYELREAVMGLHQIGLRVAMDVVYNHTNASGLGPKSVLDKVVPGYYHRQDADTGMVHTSTCCPNTATEHKMMERLMVDSIVHWATQFKIDAFRFDLMGHHMKSNMLAVRQALDALPAGVGGVYGEGIYLYGEGWNFGEVENNKRGQNAVQENMAGTGIGTFNDRLRDAARGGGPFDSTTQLRANQGFINGQGTDPNELAPAPEDERDSALLAMDQIRVGLAGSLKSFKLIDRKGSVVTGFFVPYNGAPAGYTNDPQESVTYVSKHDNQTLFDINAYKAPTGTTTADRVRMQNLGISLTLLAQGVPFLHMGVDLLRSKSMERDSYDSGDWFNRVDWTRQTNFWNVGLPRQDKDGANWPVIGEILKDTAISPMPQHLDSSFAHLKEMLAIRAQSPLLRLRTADEVKSRLVFHNTGPNQVAGLITFTLTDGTCAGDDLDPELDGMAVLINATPDTQAWLPQQDFFWQLHPVLEQSSDPVVKTAAYMPGSGLLSVPPRTTAVFVLPQKGFQDLGPACNPL